MDVGTEDIKLTSQEAHMLENAFQKEEFRKMFAEYIEEINDPDNRAKYEEEMTILEKERGFDITFLEPEAGYVIKSRTGGKKAFINICKNENVGAASCTRALGPAQKMGYSWDVPMIFSKPRNELDKNGSPCMVYDVMFNPNAFDMAKKVKVLHEFMEDSALSHVEKNFGVVLDRKNVKYPKMKYKGTPSRCVLRKKCERSGLDESVKDADDAWHEIMSKNSYGPIRPVDVPPVKTGATKSKNSQPVAPKYGIKYREYADMSKYLSGCGVNKTDMVIDVEVPLVRSSVELEVDVSSKRVSIRSIVPSHNYRVEIEFPYVVKGDDGKAEFDVQSKRLILTFPLVKPKKRCSNDAPTPKSSTSFRGSFETGSHVDTSLSELVTDCSGHLSDCASTENEDVSCRNLPENKVEILTDCATTENEDDSSRNVPKNKLELLRDCATTEEEDFCRNLPESKLELLTDCATTENEEDSCSNVPENKLELLRDCVTTENEDDSCGNVPENKLELLRDCATTENKDDSCRNVPENKLELLRDCAKTKNKDDSCRNVPENILKLLRDCATTENEDDSCRNVPENKLELLRDCATTENKDDSCRNLPENKLELVRDCATAENGDDPCRNLFHRTWGVCSTNYKDEKSSYVYSPRKASFPSYRVQVEKSNANCMESLDLGHSGNSDIEDLGALDCPAPQTFRPNEDYRYEEVQPSDSDTKCDEDMLHSYIQPLVKSVAADCDTVITATVINTKEKTTVTPIELHTLITSQGTSVSEKSDGLKSKIVTDIQGDINTTECIIGESNNIPRYQMNANLMFSESTVCDESGKHLEMPLDGKEVLSEKQEDHDVELCHNPINISSDESADRSAHNKEIYNYRSHNEEMYDDRSAHNDEMYDDRSAYNEEMYDDRSAYNEEMYDDRSAYNEEMYDDRSAHNEEMCDDRSAHNEKICDDRSAEIDDNCSPISHIDDVNNSVTYDSQKLADTSASHHNDGFTNMLTVDNSSQLCVVHGLDTSVSCSEVPTDLTTSFKEFDSKESDDMLDSVMKTASKESELYAREGTSKNAEPVGPTYSFWQNIPDMPQPTENTKTDLQFENTVMFELD